MMRRQAKESLQGHVELEYVDHVTFARFADYLYGYNYNPAEALVVLNQPDYSESSGQTGGYGSESRWEE